MFLNRLNQEEKVAFLELAHHIARSDGDFADEEKAIIQTYCFEMQIDDIEYNEANFDIKQILDKFQDKSRQKILLLEIMALIYSDGYLDESEQSVIDDIVAYFSFDKTLVKIYAEWTKSILAISNQGELLLEL